MPQTFNTLHDLVAEARRNLNQGDWDYLIGGAETETSLRRNRLAIDSYALKARVLNDVSKVQLGRALFGQMLRIPIMLAPIGSIQRFESGGGLSVARAVESFGAMQILSSVCLPDFETLAKEAPNAAKIFQLYVFGDDTWVLDHVARAKAAGYRAFCLTVDTQTYSRRERDIVKGYVPGSGRIVSTDPTVRTRFGNQASISWDLVKRIKDRFDLPLILKGIACAEDAQKACELGVDMVYVSNHGGRQLDQGRGTFEMLPEVVAAVNRRAIVAVDGCIQRGTDILKALALGADVVGIGRLEAFAMAAGGTPALIRMMELLEQEMAINLALMGLDNIDQLEPTSVFKSMPVTLPSVTSAFPLLGDYTANA